MECPGLKDCVNRRISDAEQRGVITQKLSNIENTVAEIKSALVAYQNALEAYKNETNKRINKLFGKVATISGGIVAAGYLVTHFSK